MSDNVTRLKVSSSGPLRWKLTTHTVRELLTSHYSAACKKSKLVSAKHCRYLYLTFILVIQSHSAVCERGAAVEMARSPRFSSPRPLTFRIRELDYRVSIIIEKDGEPSDAA
jgi:hypothetical protein